jgi:hypothetical protein
MIKRNIEQRMIAFIDAKLAGNGLAQHAIEVKDARLLLVQAAQACVGIREVGGNNKGPLVELIQETIGGHGQEAWCMAFVQTIIAYVEVKLGITSRLPAGEHCLTVLKESPEELRVKYFPLAGAIPIWQHGSSINGHTGFFLESLHDGLMSAVEGNTESGLTADGKVERDGGGVYMTKRSMKANGNMKIVAFLKPF